MRDLTNLYSETVEILAENGKSTADILFVVAEDQKWPRERSTKVKIEKDCFLLLAANTNYDAGYGGNEIDDSLEVVGADFWLERHESAGAEWWEYKEMPKEPELSMDVSRLTQGFLWGLTDDSKQCFSASDLVEINVPQPQAKGRVMTAGEAARLPDIANKKVLISGIVKEFGCNDTYPLQVYIEKQRIHLLSEQSIEVLD